jgi:hypothetical protein
MDITRIGISLICKFLSAKVKAVIATEAKVPLTAM